jgi:hypothetical protein
VQVDEYKSDSGHGYEVGVLYAHDEDELEFTSYELFCGRLPAHLRRRGR